MSLRKPSADERPLPGDRLLGRMNLAWGGVFYLSLGLSLAAHLRQRTPTALGASRSSTDGPHIGQRAGRAATDPGSSIDHARRTRCRVSVGMASGSR